MPPRRPDPAKLRAALDAQLVALDQPAYDGPAAALPAALVEAVLTAYDRGLEPERDAARQAVRHLLDRLATTAPGRTVEVRIPPYAAAQVIEGPRHTRGTPPNVVEMSPRTWIELAVGRRSWSEAVAEGVIAASGSRADLSAHLPLA